MIVNKISKKLPSLFLTSSEVSNLGFTKPVLTLPNFVQLTVVCNTGDFIYSMNPFKMCHKKFLTTYPRINLKA